MGLHLSLSVPLKRPQEYQTGSVVQRSALLLSSTALSVTSPFDLNFLKLTLPQFSVAESGDDDELTSGVTIGKHSRSSQPLSSHAPPILRSAFPHKSINNCRVPPLKLYRFTRKIASIGDSGVVLFTTSDEVEQIHITTNWEAGKALYNQNGPYGHTGFVGEGKTKQGIYVSDK